MRLWGVLFPPLVATGAPWEQYYGALGDIKGVAFLKP